MARKRDVAWGFFFTSDNTGKRLLAEAPTRQESRYWRSRFRPIHEAGPIFKITEPTRRKKQGKGK